MGTHWNAAATDIYNHRIPMTLQGWKLSWRTLALLVLVVAGAAYFLRSDSAATRYVTAPATRGDLVQAVTATGTVNPVVTVQVGSYVSGPIVQMLCDFNTKVKKGQLCAKIDPQLYQNTLAQAQANLANAVAQLHKDEATLAYDKITYQRDSALIRDNVISQDQLDSAKSAYDAAAAQVGVDQASIQQNQAAVNLAKVNLNYTNIIAPVDGTVVQRRFGPDRRSQFPDSDPVSNRAGPDQDAGRYQRQRIRCRSGAGRAKGRLYGRCVCGPDVLGIGRAGPPIPHHGAECRDL